MHHDLLRLNGQLPGRVLVVRLSAMGDIIHGMPAIAALAPAPNPICTVGWLMEERWAELLCARTSLNVPDCALGTETAG